MIDLDALKARGENRDTYSNELLQLHRWACATELHGELLADWLRKNPGASSADFADADFAAAVIADLRFAA